MPSRLQFAVLFLTVASLAASLGIHPADASRLGSPSLTRPWAGPTPISEDLAVDPPPSAWIGVAQPTLVMRVLNATFGVDIENIVLTIDGLRVFTDWEPANKTAWARPAAALAEGSHSAAVALYDTGSHVVRGDWTFSVDTVLPQIDLDPLPDTADARVYTMNGTVRDDHLSEVRVNAFTASVNGTRFVVPVLLWPGHNDVLAIATDLAGNRGLSATTIRWFPKPAGNVTSEAFIHSNSSFLIRFPNSWEVRADDPLGGTLRADVVASETQSVVARSNVAVVSRTVGGSMTEELLLSIMDDAIIRLGNSTTIQIVSRPRFVGTDAGAVAAQFSVVETLPEGDRAFRIVTGFWSRTVGRLWLVLGSAPTSTVELEWYALQLAVDSFRVIEPLPPPATPESPKEAIDRAFVVTVGAILFVTAFSALGFYTWRIRGRRPRVP